MSLINTPPISEKKLAAVRRNQKLSRGPATEEGRERLRAAHLRHGFYAQAEETALRALGEEPAEFNELLEKLGAQWSPTDTLQEELVARLARAVWLMNRADRMQEGYALRQAREVSKRREDRVHARMMRLKMTADSVRLLSNAVAREHYVTTLADLKLMQGLHEDGELKEMGGIALALFYQLQKPGSPGAGEPGDGEDEEEKTRQVVNEIRAVFGLGPREKDRAASAAAASGPAGGQPDVSAAAAQEVNPYPEITPEEWESREPVRQLLENILTRQIQNLEAHRHELLRESMEGPSPYERAAEIAPNQANARVMQKMQDANFRQVTRIASLLMKMKRHERQMLASEYAAACKEPPESPEQEFSSNHVVDNSGTSMDQRPSPGVANR